MIEGWSVVALAIGYVSILFAAGVVRRPCRAHAHQAGPGSAADLTPCRWPSTARPGRFFGSVGLAASTGYDFIPVYLGPDPALRVRLALPVAHRARWPRARTSPRLPTFSPRATARARPWPPSSPVIAVAGTLPYIALQLKAVAISVDALLGARPLQQLNLPTDTAFIIAIAMATFAILFGTRHIDATEHQEGLIVAVAAEIAGQARRLSDGRASSSPSPCLAVSAVSSNAPTAHPEIQRVFAQGFNGGTWITVTFLSLVCIVPAAAAVPRRPWWRTTRRTRSAGPPGCSRSIWS